MAHILRLSLDRISTAVETDYDDVLAALRGKDSSSHMEGVLAHQHPIGLVCKGVHLIDPPSLVTDCLMSCVYKSSGIESCKPLLKLGAETLISLAIMQLRNAGVRRLVLCVTSDRTGALIREEVHSSPACAGVEFSVEFVEIAPELSHAESLIAAQPFFTGPFLLSTSDHVFDDTLVAALGRTTLRPQDEACVLVETDLSRVPEESRSVTAVKVRCMDGEVLEIGRDLQEFNAVDAGLFLMKPGLFETLKTLRMVQPKISLFHAMQFYANVAKLRAKTTDGGTWIAVETDRQLIAAVDASEYERVLAPFDSINLDTMPQHDVVFALGGQSRIMAPDAFSGFSLDVSDSLSDFAYDTEESRPLVQERQRSRSIDGTVYNIGETNDKGIGVGFRTRKKSASIDDIYLIDVDARTILAVPDNVIRTRKRVGSFELPRLPSDISHIDVRAGSISETTSAKMSVTVHRKVPFIGYVILMFALIAISTLGTASEFQPAAVTGPIRQVWRCTSTALLHLPLGIQGLREQPVTWTWPLIKSTFMVSFGSGMWILTYFMAIRRTSITHATLLGNCQCIPLVLYRVIFLHQFVLLEVIAVTIGLCGVIICALEPGAGENVTALGDLVALSGSFFAAVYLAHAGYVRARLHVFTVSVIVQAVSAMMALVFLIVGQEEFTWDTNAITGLWGWVRSGNVLPQLYIDVVCTTFGVVGYITCQKYFDGLTIAMVMLAEPAIASISAIVAFGSKEIPGSMTILGGVLVVSAAATVTWAAKERNVEVDVSKQLEGESSCSDDDGDDHDDVQQEEHV